jgi:hypothetical protein
LPGRRPPRRSSTPWPSICRRFQVEDTSSGPPGAVPRPDR